jgi:hypothetical protein
MLPAALLVPAGAEATDYASAEAALSAVEALASEVTLRLRGLAAMAGAARAFAQSLLLDHERHRRERDGVRRDLGLGAAPAPPAAATEGGGDLETLKDAQSKLTYALAEALPALGRPDAVRTLARQMVDASRHLTLVGLWIEAEERRASS